MTSYQDFRIFLFLFLLRICLSFWVINSWEKTVKFEFCYNFDSLAWQANKHGKIKRTHKCQRACLNWHFPVFWRNLLNNSSINEVNERVASPWNIEYINFSFFFFEKNQEKSNVKLCMDVQQLCFLVFLLFTLKFWMC